MMYRDRPRKAWQRWLARTCLAVQDRLWAADESFARERGYRSTRSRNGWMITVRDPRWDGRQRCAACAGSGSGRSGRDCAACHGIGVVTDDVEDVEERR